MNHFDLQVALGCVGLGYWVYLVQSAFVAKCRFEGLLLIQSSLQQWSCKSVASKRRTQGRWYTWCLDEMLLVVDTLACDVLVVALDRALQRVERAARRGGTCLRAGVLVTDWLHLSCQNIGTISGLQS